MDFPPPPTSQVGVFKVRSWVLKVFIGWMTDVINIA
jgi:hypothetical protein